MKQLNREIFTSVQYAIEHPDDNIHFHSICESVHDLTVAHFKSHIRKFGNIKIQRVIHDNGLLEYISKESEVMKIEK